MTSIAAILTIVGYSLNETVVVFDRTRELMRRYKTMPTVELLEPVDQLDHVAHGDDRRRPSSSSLLALVLFGGEAIEGFAQVMLFGVVICTYSAIFISSPMLIYLGLRSLRGGVTARGRQGRRSRQNDEPMAWTGLRGLRPRPASDRLPTAMAASASPTCPIAARSWRCRRASRRVAGRAPCRADARGPRAVFAEGERIDLLLLGTGATSRLPAGAVPRAASRGAGSALDVMQTGAAARTYNILLGENRKVGAALIAVA